ncbi:MAG: S41 family peptidase [Ruminococcus sp.]|nr:S41 family peptidase [Ruminococcus sp.]
MEEMQKREKWSWPLRLLAILAAVLMLVSLLLLRRNYMLEKELAENARMAELEDYVEENFYQDVDEEAAMDGALKGYVAGLNDPYSSYLTEDEYSDWQVKESGTTVGIGVTVQAIDEDGLLIIEVNPGSPAEQYGLLPEDLIVAVDGQRVSELGYEESVAAVKGQIGTEVVLTVERDGEELDISVVRDEVVTITAFGQMLEENVGYIRISAFRANTDEQFTETLETLLEQGAESLIFDVRNNGGGLLSSLEDTLDPLLPEGVIAIANYGNGTERTIVESDAEELDLPMAVLVNENTASAAELFAASLRDFDKAFLVGTTTFGKGVMQDTRKVSGGAVTLTVATYQTVKGECYHGVGLTPDEVVALGEDFTVDYEDPDLQGDAQLKKACESITG